MRGHTYRYGLVRFNCPGSDARPGAVPADTCPGEPDREIFGSPYLTGVPPIGPLRPAHPDPVGRTYGALATAPLLVTFRDRLRRGSLLACRAVRVVAMRTRRAWLRGLANPRAF